MDVYVAAHRGSDGGRIAELELTIWANLGDRAPGFDVIEPVVRENAETRAVAEKGHALFPGQPATPRPRCGYSHLSLGRPAAVTEVSRGTSREGL
jgi:hypothetical protein